MPNNERGQEMVDAFSKVGSQVRGGKNREKKNERKVVTGYKVYNAC